MNPKFSRIKQFPKDFFTNVGYYSLIVLLVLIKIQHLTEKRVQLINQIKKHKLVK
jgi:hypothetical protein